MKKKIDLNLPEWSFLDADNQTGNALEGRDVLLHVRTHTILEIFPADVMSTFLDKNVVQRIFNYENMYGVDEKHVIAVHYSLAEFADLDEVITKAVKFYSDWMNWMDGNIVDDETIKLN